MVINTSNGNNETRRNHILRNIDQNNFSNLIVIIFIIRDVRAFI